MSLRDRLALSGLRDRLEGLRLRDRLTRSGPRDRRAGSGLRDRCTGTRVREGATPREGLARLRPGDRPAPVTPRSGAPATMSARPVDRAWPALPLSALGVATLVALVGVAAAPQPSETDRIADTVKDFAAAVQEQRGEDACALLTPAGRQAVTARLGTLGCAATIRSFGFGIDPGVLRVARVAGVQIVGDRATIPRAQLIVPGGKPFGRTIALERVDGEWRIATVT